MDLEFLLTEELQQEFLEYLKEDPEFQNLNEDVLNEGKLLKKINNEACIMKDYSTLFEDAINEYTAVKMKDNPSRETRRLSQDEASRMSTKDKFEARFGSKGTGHKRDLEVAVDKNHHDAEPGSGTTKIERSEVQVDSPSAARGKSEAHRTVNRSGKYTTEPDSQVRLQRSLDNKRSQWRSTFKRKDGKITRDFAYTEDDIEGLTDDYVNKLNKERVKKGLKPVTLKRSKRGKGRVRDLQHVNESFSDYDLYLILQENGYETSSENLEIFKEGLLSGHFDIEFDFE